jgi:hypothetical protein
VKIGILLAVLAYLFILVVGVGSWLARREKKKEAVDGEFALGGRSLSTPVVAVTLAFSVLGTAHILGVFELSWTLGAAAVWFSLAHVILLVVVCLSTGLWVRRLGVSTVPEILGLLFGGKTRTLVSCVMAGVVTGLLTLETQGLGILTSTMTGWPIRQGAIVGGVIGILYVVLAGMKEIGYLNVINALVKYGGLILATLFLAMQLPGGDFGSVKAFYVDAGHPEMLSIFGTPEIMATFALGTVVAVLFSQGISQMLLQPAMGARNEKTIRKALWIAAPVNGMFGVFAVGSDHDADHALAALVGGSAAGIVLDRGVIHLRHGLPRAGDPVQRRHIQAPVPARCSRSRYPTRDADCADRPGRRCDWLRLVPAADSGVGELAILLVGAGFLAGGIWSFLEAQRRSGYRDIAERLGCQLRLVLHISAGYVGPGRRAECLRYAGRDLGDWRGRQCGRFGRTRLLPFRGL